MSRYVLKCLLYHGQGVPVPEGRSDLFAYQEHLLSEHEVSQEDLIQAQRSTVTTETSVVYVWTLPHGRPWLRAERLLSLFKAVLVAEYPQDALASALDVSLDILAKLYARVIERTSIPAPLLEHLAELLKVRRELIEADLDGPPKDISLLRHGPGPQQPWGKESFRQSVSESPLLSQRQKAAWLALMDAEGKG